MGSLAIIKHLNVFKDSLPGLVASMEMAMKRQLALERGEEALHGRIVPGVGRSAHTDHNLILGQQLAIIITGILAAPVGVVQQAVADRALGQGHLQGRLGQFILQARGQRPA